MSQGVTKFIPISSSSGLPPLHEIILTLFLENIERPIRQEGWGEICRETLLEFS